MRARQPTPAEQAFLSAPALNPYPQIVLETGHSSLCTRLMDLLAPLGRGQRGLIVASPGLGKTTVLKEVCRAVAQGYPEMKIYCLLIDERPEEVTDFRRNVNGELFASSLDQDAAQHLKIVNQLMPQAFEAAAAGQDVLILLDSLTRLTRAFHSQGRGGRTLSGGLSADALTVPRQIFGAARNVEGMGSITILATILVDTGSQMDQVIFEEFKGTGNMELVLSKTLAQERYFPAIHALKSGTRRSELFYSPADYDALNTLHQRLAALDELSAMRYLRQAFKQFPDNGALLQAFAD